MASAIAGGIGHPHDLPGGVDAISETVTAAQGAEVGHGPATVQEGVASAIARGIGHTHDLPGGVDCGSVTVTAAQGAEVGHVPATVQEGMRGIAEGSRLPDDLPETR